MLEMFIQAMNRVLIQDAQPPLEQEVIDLIYQKAEIVQFPRKHKLVKAGRVSDQILFLNSGIARSYKYRFGKEQTTWFMQKGDMAMSPKSYITGLPSDETVELLTSAEVVMLKKFDQQHLYEQFRSVNYVGRRLIENYHVRVIDHLELVNLTAQQRYQVLLEQAPELLSQVPLKYVASFLGIHDKTLREVRAAR
ncbi:hypothetical protein MKQ68_18935 [Chitinophaga horti]|uniref:cAMP-binding domain of CRP or a regulatory subunit of cAMP-dependent protein kinases n=1 Tax=Chitinophaga horti TaxID=2920382 RepID=A0ABY6IXP9_9BACT|nr:hypothetical protein [Chitinophaga horti]UYQ92166.1 hypothetical protein MKQ68_18935 [Chitinophaga horti]